MNKIHIDPHSIAESNARITARGNYSRWLLKRFQHLHLLDMVDDMDPISLRRIFVPLQVAEQEIREEAQLSNDEQQGKLPGEALWDVLGREKMLLLSGGPGSGKSTLVQAMVVDLLSEFSDLRGKIAKPPGIFPIPIVLRNYPIEKIGSLDALLDYWWEEAKKQAEADKRSLDIERLKFSFDPKGDAFPVILLLDGIDETGGQKNRQKIMDFALEAGRRSWRVLLTGRPDGFAGLRFEKKQGEHGIDGERRHPFYVLPFAWPQIERFVEAWYKLRPEWERQKQLGVKRFLAALRDKNRSYLLSLARRPIFLTLMAHVHCTDNQMPEGRAALYARIVDLYLNRQENHRLRKEMLDGKAIPHWPYAEKRLVLGYLAWQSQKRPQRKSENSRQVACEKTETIGAIRTQLNTSEYGRFTSLKPKDAENLLKYFLWPVGLLVEPAEDTIQFTHLSFQEYLCADYLYNRGRVKGWQTYLEKELFKKLKKPGWMEVAILLLSIHARETTNEGHFQMLSWLDPSNRFHAQLLMRSIFGGELPFTENEQLAWLPLAMICVLLHPMDYISPLPFTGVSNGVRKTGREILIKILNDEKEVWSILKENFKGYTVGSEEQNLWSKAENRWDTPPEKDKSWPLTLNREEARMQGLILLSAALGEGGDTPVLKDIADSKGTIWKLAPEGALAAAMADWLNKMDPRKDWGKPPSLFWQEKQDDDRKILFPTLSATMANMIGPASGVLWSTLMDRMPLAFFLLQGEESLDDDFWKIPWRLDSILLSFYPTKKELLPSRLVPSLVLYQILVLADALPISELNDFSGKKSSSLSLSRSHSLKGLLSWPLSQLRALPLSLSQSCSQPQEPSLTPLLSLSRSLLRFLSVRKHEPDLADSNPQIQPHSLLRRLLTAVTPISNFKSIEEKLTPLSRKIKGLLDEKELLDSIQTGLLKTLISSGLQICAWDWFDKQASNPDLMIRRGMNPGEPLPSQLGLFDAKGFPLPAQKQENWVALQNWLNNNNAVLDFCFEGKALSALDREILLDDLKYLKTCSWSPHEAVRIAVENWPKNDDGSYGVCAFDLDVFVKELERVVDEIALSLENPAESE